LPHEFPLIPILNLRLTFAAKGIFTRTNEFAMTKSMIGTAEAVRLLVPETAGRWRSLGRAVLLVAGVFVGQMILYGPSLLGQKVLLPLDVLALPQVYLPQTPELQKTLLHNFVLSDLAYIGEPSRRFLSGELRAGRWPSWNPHQFAGSPSLAPRFSPFTLLSTCFTSPVIIAWVQMLVAELAGIGFYLFGRRVLGIGFWSAAIGGWCYPLTSFFIFWQGYGLSFGVCWLPWLLLAVDAVVQGGTRWAWPIMALCTGLVVVSGQTDVAGQVLLTSGLFALWRLVEVHRQHLFSVHGQQGSRHTPRAGRPANQFAVFSAANGFWRTAHGVCLLRSLRTALLLAGGWGVGFLLAAPHLLPMLEYTRTGARMERRSKGEEERPPVGLAALPQVVVPHFYGSTEAGFFPAFPASQGNLLESSATGYAGLLATLLIAPLAFCSRRHRSLNLFWVLLAFVALSWQLNIPGMVQLLRSPLLNMMSHNRFVFAAAFSILAMAAVGLEVLACGQWTRRWWFGIPVALLAVLLFAAVFLAIVPPEPIRSQLALAVSRGQAVGQIASVDAVREIQGNFLRTYLVTVGLCVLGLVGWLCVWRQPRVPGWLLAVAGTLMVAELLWYGYGRAAQCDWSLYYPEIPVLKQIAQAAEVNHSRVIGAGRLVIAPADQARRAGLTIIRAYRGESDPVLALVPGCLPAALAQTQGLSDVRGYDAVDPARYVNLLLKAADPHSPQISYALTQMMIPALFDQPSGILRLHPILDMLGVRYLIFRGTPIAGIQPDFAGDDYWVMENRFALPRTFVPQRVETLADEKKCLNQLADLSFNPRQVAYIESELAAALPAECRGTAEIIRETPTEILVSATMETAGMLVLADRWDRGWDAYIEGKPTPIRQVNYAVRGVELPAGKAEIAFRYEPASMTWGLWLGGLALVIILVTCIPLLSGQKNEWQ